MNIKKNINKYKRIKIGNYHFLNKIFVYFFFINHVKYFILFLNKRIFFLIEHSLE